MDAATVQAAVTFLRRTSLPIEPRKKWPDGGLAKYELRGAIAEDLQAEAGRALCIWGDAGWGSIVRDNRYQDERFSEQLVKAFVEMVQKWRPQPAPQWVTAIPSLKHPVIVPDFARRVAAALGLPYHEALKKVEDRPEQKYMANSNQQARNLDGSLEITGIPLPQGPVLLVDDIVNSRWTLTVAAWLLRKNGSGEVWPAALSQTGHSE